MRKLQAIVALAAAIAVQIMLGGVYAWSSLVPALVHDLSLTPLQTQTIFGCMIAVFTITMLASDRILERLGPQKTTAVAGILFAAGYGLVVWGKGSFPAFLSGLSGLTGLAMGLGYICPLRIGIAWFPRKKGLVTGLVTAGFGIGGVVLATGIQWALTANIAILPLLGWVGTIYGTVILFSSLFLTLPEKESHLAPNATSATNTSVSLRTFLQSSNFGVWSKAMYCGTFAGLLIIGNLGPLILDRGGSKMAAALAVSAFAVGNGIGRISWGVFYDRWQSRAVPWSFVVTFVTTALMALPAVPVPLMPLLALALGFGFGGCFVLFAALTADHYGTDKLPRLYPWVFLFYGAAGIVGPALGGLLLQITGHHQFGLLLAAVSAAVGAAIFAFGQKRPVVIRFLPVQEREPSHPVIQNE